MEKFKWSHRLDKYLEDRVWSKVPKKYSTPHFFFLLGWLTCLVFFIILSIITKILL